MNEGVSKLEFSSSFIFNIFVNAQEKNSKQTFLFVAGANLDDAHTREDRGMIIIKNLEALEVC